MLRRIFGYLLLSFALCAACGAGAGVTAELVYHREETAGSFVQYPQVTGMGNLFVQDTVNRTILEKGRIREHLLTLASLMDPGSMGIEVNAEAHVFEGSGGEAVLSVLISAEGRMPGGRPGSASSAMLFSLSSGELLTASVLFNDSDEAADSLSGYIREQLLDEISDYANAEGLLPLPMDNVFLDDAGITFCYPAERFSFLSGRSGAINFRFYEMEGLLALSPDSLLAQLGLGTGRLSGPEAAAGIRAACEEGRLPGIPASIGDALSECARRYGQTMDPEYFPDGAKYQMESAAFRGTWLIAGEEEGTTVEGILSGRMDLSGIVTGQSAAGDYRALLGEPRSSLPLGAEAAEAYGLPEGLLESYTFGHNRLTFSTDADQIVRAVWILTEQP